MVKKRELIYGIIFSAIVILFMWLVMAAIDSNPSVRVISPANYTNNSGTITFNVTFLNTTGGGIVNPKNVTFYYNFSVNWAPISNSSGFVLNGSCFNVSSSCFVTIVKGAPGYNLSDGTYTINASIDNGTDQTSVSLANNLSVNVLIDNTPPMVFNGNITSPVTERNYSGNLLLNVSVLDTLATVRAVVFNITNGTSGQNATRIATQIGVIFFNYTIPTTHFPDGLYNVTILANDTTNGGNVNGSAMVQLIRFDNTKPFAFSNNISKPLSGSNHTGTIVFNATFTDALSGVGALYFNVTNGTGGQNATYPATREGSTERFTASVNTAQMKDGNYSVTLFANDSAGNLNNSAATLSIIFDNTVPAVSVSCSPATVTAGDAITCTCTRSDATSGINTVNFVANPSTTSTGTFTSSCTATDFAGNSGSGSATYRVESGGSGASSSGGGGSSSSGGEVTKWKATYSVTEADFKEGETRELKQEQRLKVSVSNEDHYVGVVSASGKSATIEVASTPKRITLNVGETTKFDVTNDNYYDMSIKLNSVVANKASITLLSIHEKVPAPVEPEAEVVAPVEPEAEIASAPPVTEAGEGSSLWKWVALIIAVLVIAGLIVWFVKKR